MTETRIDMSATEFAYSHRIAILLIVLVSVFMAVLDNNIVAIALPTITDMFHVSLGQSQWIATAYIITIIATVIVFGTLAPAIGMSRLFLSGLLVFVASSAACGFAGSLSLLVAARVVQGLGAAMMMSISMAIILRVFPPDERGRAMGYVTATVALGLIIGPALGGILVDSFGWPFVFFVNVPLGLVLLVPGFCYLRLGETREENRAIDWPGAVLLIVLMTAVALILNEFSNPPVNPGVFTAFAFTGLATLAAFIFWEKRAERPLLDLSLFGIRGFVLPSMSLILYLTATFILIILLPFYFEGVLGYRPTQVGLVAFVMPVAMMASSPVCGWVYDKFRPDHYALTGVFVMGLAFLLCGYGYATGNINLVIAALVLAGICRSIFQGPNTLEIMGALPHEKAGLSSSILVVLQDFGIMLGISLGTIFLAFQLDRIGYTGVVLQAGPEVLPGIFGNAMYAGGLICIAAAIFSYKKQRGSNREGSKA
ncbi:MAG: DHA2 family efflux MFS transporter permease subunit [Methanoregulaceae archaeon]